MFFIKELRKDLLLLPQYLGPKILSHVKAKLSQELTGQCLGKHGYVLSILEIDDNNILPGKIENDTGKGESAQIAR